MLWATTQLDTRRHINLAFEDILQHRCIGLVKCEVIPNKNLKILVLPGNDDGKLLFHNNTMAGTLPTLELRKSLEWVIL